MHDRLRQRGWTESELGRLKPLRENRFTVILSISLLALSVIAIPYGYGLFAGHLPQAVILTTLLLISIPLGSVFAVLLTDLDRLDRHHHVIILLAIPCAALAGAWILIATSALIPAAHNPLIGGLVYALGIITPYAFLVKKEWNLLTGH